MIFRTSTLQRTIGTALVAAGTLVALRWIFRIEWIARAIPGSAEMGINAPVLFIAAGACCLALSGAVRERTAVDRLALACIGLLLLLPGLTLVQHLFGVNLGIDFVRVPTPPTATSPHPGRMSPNTTLAFLCAGMAFALARQPRVRTRWLMTSCVVTLSLISLAGLAGYFLGLESLYRFGNYNRMLAPTAVGLLVLALALWLVREHAYALPRQLSGHMARITSRSVVALSLVALASGVAGFAVLRDAVDRSLAQNLRLAVVTNAAAIGNSLEGALGFPRGIVTQPDVRDALARVSALPADRPRQQLLQKIAEGFSGGGVDTVEFLSTSGRVLAHAGPPKIAKPVWQQPLKADGLQAFFVWSDGYVVTTRMDVVVEGRPVGHVRTEQRLRFLDTLLKEIRASSESSDALVCMRESDDALCAPSRFYPDPVRIPMFGRNGELNLPINHALVGQSGVTKAQDLRGIDVAAAYQPIAAGLAMVVKTDLDTLYAPLKDRMNLLIMLLIGLVATGTYALRLGVQPLLGQIVAEKERTRVILDNSNDAFIALGPQGLVTDWNRQAETMFGWSSAEAMGRRLSELIIPPEQRRAHEDGLQRFAATGAGPVIDRRIEVMGMRRDGSQFPVEMSITAYHDGQGHVSNAFMRDITQRRAAEERLQSSEKRLRDITDNLPVLISYIDHEQRFTFVNQTIGRWMGIDAAAAVGQRCVDVMSAQIYEQRAPYIARALAGERVSFELSTRMQDVERDLSNEYIPDRRADGSIAGVYVLSTDVSELKKVQRTLLALARYDTLTGLPNRLLFNEKLQEAIARSARSQQPLALMFLDVDNFKSINDSLGHAAGDLVLQAFAARLRTSVRETDTVARLAGDEFVVVLEGLHSTAEPQFVARKILSQIAREFDIEGRKLQVTTSIGVAYHDSGTVQPAQLLALADKALYEAKAAGRNGFAFAAAPATR